MKYKTRSLTDTIVVHCSATPPNRDIGRKEIDQWHRERSWLAIGYHVVIRRNGDIEWGRPLDAVGAHVESQNNYSIGICMVGGVNAKNEPEDNFTSEQYAALEVVLRGLRSKFDVDNICGHRDLDSGKACPSFDVGKYLTKIGLSP